ncbi:MAG: ABC transporter ATP-binding protein [Ornithinimicrobium sp.]|uniref:ABC transporter ATP-binding protein n=1 Tax=Ornithinimicrobium sp. TaxID=1977084 RepID=UPI0026E0CBF6|nr:ABC transporter ATP-binding protein [Ornithinimicrobium sp.]MDO5740026.1 ABC transporter ATP-binding protein [Ornithinimicrobium sp.]
MTSQSPQSSPPPHSHTPVLSTHGLVSGYAGSRVLHGVDIAIPEGGVLALLGRNGVGKTTLVSTIMGLIRPMAGSVMIAGQEVAGARPDRIARLGVGLVPQGRRVFAPLTVAEHLEIADRSGRSGSWTQDRVIELLPRLGERLRNRGDQLSGGEQQMLAIARSLLTNPTILLLDEPSDGLAPSIVNQVADVIHEVCGHGMSVLIVEQNLRLALSVADHVVVMQKGTVQWDVPVEEFRRNRLRAEELLGI